MTGRVNIEKFNKGFAADANKINPSSNNNNISEYPRKTTDEQPVKRKTINSTSVRIESEIVRGKAVLKSSRTPSNTTTIAKTTPSSEAQPITTTSTELYPTVSPQRSQETLTTTSSTTLPSTTPTTTPTKTPTTAPSTPPTTRPTTIAKQEGASVAFESESRSLCSRKRNRTEEKDGSDPNVAKAQKTVVESSTETIEEVDEEEEEKEEEEETSEEEEEEEEESQERDRRRISLWHKKQLVMYKIKQEEIDLSPFGIDGEHDIKESVLSVNKSTK